MKHVSKNIEKKNWTLIARPINYIRCYAINQKLYGGFKNEINQFLKLQGSLYGARHLAFRINNCLFFSSKTFHRLTFVFLFSNTKATHFHCPNEDHQTTSIEYIYRDKSSLKSISTTFHSS